MAKLVAPEGTVRGVDIELPSGGKRSYDVAKNGIVEVTNERDAAKLKQEGFIDAALGSFAHVQGFPCGRCEFNSVFKAYTCPKCGEVNDYRD
jgi:hypothetical protein